MRAYKLFRVMADGSIASLFIDPRARHPLGEWMPAAAHRRKGFAFHPGWHCTAKPEAPHLSMEGRAWFEVEVENFEAIIRPTAQGGTWFLEQQMKIVRRM